MTPSHAASDAQAMLPSGPAAAAVGGGRRDVFLLPSTGPQATTPSVAGSRVGGSAAGEGVVGLLDGSAMTAEREYVEREYQRGPVAYLLGKSQLRAADRRWFKVMRAGWVRARVWNWPE